MMRKVALAAFLFALIFTANGAWVRKERTSPDTEIEFKVALKQRNLDQLEALYWSRTDPTSSDYAKWLTVKEINELVAPPQEVHARVRSWLSQHGITDTKSYGDFIVVRAAAQNVERLFGYRFYRFANDIKKWSIHRFEQSYTLPAAIKDVVDFVTGVNDFPVTGPKLKKTLAGPAATTTITGVIVPETLRTLYNVSDTLRVTNAKSSQAVVEFGAQAGISTTDLATFAQQTNSPTASLAYTVGNFVFNPTNPVDGESTLDVQYITAMGIGAQTSFWVVNGWIYDFAALVLQRSASNQPVPWIFSISYGWAEAQQCSITGAGQSCVQQGGTDTTYVIRTNSELQKVGLLGVTLVAASGDAGAASKWNIQCNLNPLVNPEYPAASPFVLTVGATMLSPPLAMTQNLPPICQASDVSCARGGTEVVCSVPVSSITSGGGFSNIAARPSYQNAAVSNWLSLNSLRPPANLFNSTNRGYPDVSAQGHLYFIVENGKGELVDGTSASTPVVAGMIAFLNDYRFSKGLSSLGPINTLFYQIGARTPKIYFNDITFGNNTGTESSKKFPNGCQIPFGYGATVGWDPVSGLGTLNFGNILSFVKTLTS